MELPNESTIYPSHSDHMMLMILTGRCRPHVGVRNRWPRKIPLTDDCQRGEENDEFDDGLNSNNNSSNIAGE